MHIRSVRTKETDVPLHFPIVGIGASAGGLDAFTRLLKHLSIDTGMTFVLVQHLDPTHQSSLTEILSKVTKMPVQTVKNGTLIKPNHVYVIPPNTNMSIRQGRLKLMPRSATNGLHMPIDYFLRSLASDRKNMAVGVILSGTGSDGALAMETIKSEGGITFAQDQHSAKFVDMPRNAAATAHVDFIFPPERIARELSLLAPRLRSSSLSSEVAEPREKDPELQEIFRMVRAATSFDFSHYKHSTLQRRIERRLALHKIKNLKEYVEYLRTNPEEVKALSQEFLIPVTSFFRDPQAFEALKTTVFPRLLQNRLPDAPIRIWVAGCSTGQEAYSLAICLHEFLGKHPANVPIQIFASDISEASLEKARAGSYIENIALDVSPERLKKFFMKTGNTYRVSKTIRDLCVFARQNVTQDPPFSQLDLISCRNLLIYFTPELQKKVLSTFHYSLKFAGFLLLGKSETVGACADLFGLVNKKARIYARKAVQSRAQRTFSTPVLESQYAPRSSAKKLDKDDGRHARTIQEEADRITLTRFAPAGVIINEDMEILEFRGDTSTYLKPAPGKASLHLLKMAREGLLVELHSAIKHVLKENIPTHREGIRMSDADRISFEVLPLVSSGQRCFLILFQRMPIVSTKHDKKSEQKESSAESQLIGQLEQELAAARDYLQAVTREHEIANEELQTANEEVLSSNEEFQSTNEELETSKEELQSTNEELTTVNEELQNRNTEMTELNRSLAFSKDYIEAIFKTVREPLLVLNSELRVQMANQTFYRTFKVEEEKTIKRLIYDLGNGQWNIPELRRLLEDVIPENTHFEDFRVVHTFPDIGRKVMLLNARTIQPQNTSDARLILLAIEDVTEKEEKEERTHLQILEDMLANIPMAGLAVSAKQGTLHVNEQLCMLFNLDHSHDSGGQLSLPNIINKLQEQVIDPADYGKKLKEIWRMTIPLLGQEVRLKDDRILLCDYAPVFHADVHAGHIILYRDITRERRIDATKSEFMSLASHQLRTPLTSIRWAMGRLGNSMATKTSDMEGRLLEEGKNAATRMSETIDTMLQIARIESEEVQIHVSRIALRPFLQKAILESKESTGKKQILSLTCPVGLAIHTDSKLLQEILRNLLSNAQKYTPLHGKIRVRVRKKKDAVIIDVQDSGYGIPIHQHKKIFQKFFRGDNIVGRDTEGTGLGLYLVLLITNLLGGKICFVSVEGKRKGRGSTFTLSLPVLPRQR
jgi:two-component system CheB/CheR fusion protein